MIQPANHPEVPDPTKTISTDGVGSVDTPCQSGDSFLSLGKSITGWTSNLLATAIIIVIASTLGSQLVSSWIREDSFSNLAEFTINQPWSALQACSLEFGDSPFQLTREKLTGAESEVVLFLQTRCREALEDDAQPVSAMGERESWMINHSADQTPIEQIEGKWRIFLGPKLEESRPLPIALGIRDDCLSSPSGSHASAQPESRLVVWALAIPNETGDWTTFVARASTLSRSHGSDRFLPSDANRTMSMTNPDGHSLIGFSGGEFESAITFYKELAREKNWRLEIEPTLTPNSWSGRFLPTGDSTVKAAQVHLTHDHQENLTGILMMNSKKWLEKNNSNK